jgi:L,D-transpeptidase YbiS
MNDFSLRRLEVSVARQCVELWEDLSLLKTWPVSTSKYGLGSQPGSNRTPLGFFEVAEKYGDEAPLHTIFRSREPSGEWDGLPGLEDLILARILRLKGCEGRNQNTYDRYIYFHGTNGFNLIGRPASHGCIRMRNEDIVALFPEVEVGTPVWIEE